MKTISIVFIVFFILWLILVSQSFFHYKNLKSSYLKKRLIVRLIKNDKERITKTFKKNYKKEEKKFYNYCTNNSLKYCEIYGYDMTYINFLFKLLFEGNVLVTVGVKYKLDKESLLFFNQINNTSNIEVQDMYDYDFWGGYERYPNSNNL